MPSRKSSSTRYDRKSPAFASHWGEVSPKRGPERRELSKRCGSKCFLEPPMGFPVCAVTNIRSCEPDCLGIRAAMIRAAQWHHTTAHKKASELFEKYNCAGSYKSGPFSVARPKPAHKNRTKKIPTKVPLYKTSRLLNRGKEIKPYYISPNIAPSIKAGCGHSCVL